MKITKNIIKGLITSTIGVITMLLTLLLVFTGMIDFVWSGAVGLIIGCALLIAPDTLVKKVANILSSIAGKRDDGNDPISIDTNKKVDNPDGD